MTDEQPESPSRVLLIRASIDLAEQQTPTDRSARYVGEYASLLYAVARPDGDRTIALLLEVELSPADADRLADGAQRMRSDLDASARTGRRARKLEFGSGGGLLFTSATPASPAHMPNPHAPEPLPLPLRALPALAPLLVSPGRVLLGEGIAAFDCGLSATPLDATISPPDTTTAACGFVFRLSLKSSFSRTPHPTDSLPLKASGEYDLRIVDRTDATPYALLAHKVSFTAMSYPVLRWDDAIALGNLVP